MCPVCGSRNLTKIDRMNGYLSYSGYMGTPGSMKRKWRRSPTGNPCRLGWNGWQDFLLCRLRKITIEFLKIPSRDKTESSVFCFVREVFFCQKLKISNVSRALLLYLSENFIYDKIVKK